MYEFYSKYRLFLGDRLTKDSPHETTQKTTALGLNLVEAVNRFYGVLIHAAIIKLPRDRDVANVAGLADLTCRLCTYETLSGEGL
jgi:hypothetical protein